MCVIIKASTWPCGKAAASSRTSDSNLIGTPVATLPDEWRNRAIAMTGGPFISLL